MRAAAALALILFGCNDTKSSKAPPHEAINTHDEASREHDKSSPSPGGEVLPPGARSPKVTRPSKLGAPLEWNTTPPELDTKVTGFVTKDPNARELSRCKNTAWSYSGCWTVYPTQGRVWTKFECEHVVDDHMRNLVCHNYASHLAVGDGGPPDLSRALEILQIGCDAGVRADCARIGQLVMWDDPERAAGYVTKACDDPRNSPIGLCQDLEAAPPELHRYAVTVTDVRGLDGITTATKCSLGVIDRGDTCRVRFACGDRMLYGALSGQAPCKRGARGPVGGESMTSTDDGDPAIAFDGKTVQIHDEAAASSPAFDLRGTLTTR